ncbi:MAG: hypothetical protein ABR949_10175 [Candidatus Aquilonibacter sp.]|jgi:hypothetical protein
MDSVEALPAVAQARVIVDCLLSGEWNLLKQHLGNAPMATRKQWYLTMDARFNAPAYHPDVRL